MCALQALAIVHGNANTPAPSTFQTYLFDPSPPSSDFISFPLPIWFPLHLLLFPFHSWTFWTFFHLHSQWLDPDLIASCLFSMPFLSSFLSVAFSLRYVPAWTPAYISISANRWWYYNTIYFIDFQFSRLKSARRLFLKELSPVWCFAFTRWSTLPSSVQSDRVGMGYAVEPEFNESAMT